MASTDPRGNPCGSSQSAAQAAAEQALWRMMSFYDTPQADLDTARQADPGWALPDVMQAGFLLSLTEPALHGAAAALLARAEPLAAHAPARERAHLQAVLALLQGRWQAACHIWGELLVDHPRDALALQWAQLWDFHRGDAPALRRRPARALPEWDEADPLQPYVLALHAFGLQENNLYPEAEEAGRRALLANPRVPWAVHAVAHVMEMQGRFEDGAAWLRQQQPYWAEGNGFSRHLWWHKGLFRLESLDVAGVLRLVDHQLSGAALQVGLHRIDAASLLWRLRLLGQDVTGQFAQLLAGWPLDEAEAGLQSFNDLHVVLALLGAGEQARAEHWVARCAARALQPEDARRSNHAVARELGLPLLRGLLAFGRGQPAEACRLWPPLLAQLQRLGGSQAQRDVIEQTLLAACAAGGSNNLGRALLNERRLARPMTPLRRHWQAQLQPTAPARA